MDVSSLGDHTVRIILTGRLDTQGVDRVETRFTAAVLPGANNAIVDLSKIEFMASMGIRMLVSVARTLKTRQARLVVYGVPETIGDVLEAVSLQKIIPICATEAEALAAISVHE